MPVEAEITKQEHVQLQRSHLKKTCASAWLPRAALLERSAFLAAPSCCKVCSHQPQPQLAQLLRVCLSALAHLGCDPWHITIAKRHGRHLVNQTQDRSPHAVAFASAPATIGHDLVRCVDEHELEAPERVFECADYLRCTAMIVITAIIIAAIAPLVLVVLLLVVVVAEGARAADVSERAEQ